MSTHSERRAWSTSSAAVAMAVALVGSAAPVLAPPAAAHSSVLAAASAREPLLAYGSRGAAVQAWQSRLNTWRGQQGLPLLATDGIFGPRTRAATLHLQRRAGTTVDGIVGPRTRAALGRLLAPDTGAPFEGTVGIAEREATGPVGAVTDIRFGYHDGFDRIVFDLTDGAVPGWRVAYVDSPVRAQGSGHVIPLEGDGQLEITLRGIPMPADAGGAYYRGPQRPDPGRTGVVEEVAVDGLFEGHFVTFAGARSPEPFRIFSLQDPLRVVVDIAHPD